MLLHGEILSILLYIVVFISAILLLFFTQMSVTASYFKNM